METAAADAAGPAAANAAADADAEADAAAADADAATDAAGICQRFEHCECVVYARSPGRHPEGAR